MTNLLFALFFMCTTVATAMEYTGNNIITVLGENPSSENFNQFKTYWLLDATLQNPNSGIRLYTDKAGNRIDTVLLSGYGYENFRTCSSALPFGIALTDNVEAIKKKVGSDMVKHGDDYFFNGPGVVLRVHYLSYGRIQSLRVYKGKLSILSEATTLTTKPVVATTGGSTVRIPNVITTNVATTSGPTPLHKAVMQVFNSWKESSFSSLKGSERQSGNFWDYKYTYSSRVKIPGEKFSMLYSFPFITSSLDYVSVLKEAETYDSSFETVYKQFEKDMSLSFSKAEGWQGRCLPNTDGSKLSDLEYKHPVYGSVILDYCRHPKGKHVLYMRFVPYS
jgi:hypothetical protein